MTIETGEGRFNPAGVSDQHYAAIGKVAAAWAYLELTIDTSIALLLGVDEEAAATLTNQLIGTARRLDALEALIILRQDGEHRLEGIRKLSGRIQRLANERNRVIHDPWIMRGVDAAGFMEEPGVSIGIWVGLRLHKKYGPHRLPMTTKGGNVTKQFVHAPTEDVLDLADRIEATARAVSDLMLAGPPVPPKDPPEGQRP